MQAASCPGNASLLCASASPSQQRCTHAGAARRQLGPLAALQRELVMGCTALTAAGCEAEQRAVKERRAVHDAQPLSTRRDFQAQKRRVAVPLAQRTDRPSATISTRPAPLVYRPFGRLALRSPPQSAPRTTPRRKPKTLFSTCALSNTRLGTICVFD